MDIGDEAGAEAPLVAAPHRIQGGDYGTLVPLAALLEAQGRWTGATVVYRALLEAILERGYTPAYCHGARYWTRGWQTKGLKGCIALRVHRVGAAGSPAPCKTGITR